MRGKAELRKTHSCVLTTQQQVGLTDRRITLQILTREITYFVKHASEACVVKPWGKKTIWRNTPDTPLGQGRSVPCPGLTGSTRYRRASLSSADRCWPSSP